ncbi:MAG TPA: rhodanese-like domain-containing protein [Planctomycetota bacterium]|nr:rhodanese-like domain-containing protein [Planctomycetota bacterium]
MRLYALVILAGLAVGVLALAAACEPKDQMDCSSGVCLPAADREAQATPAKAEPKEAAPEGKEKHEINTQVLATLIDSGAPMVILDARTGKYDDGRRIPGAKALSPQASAAEAAKVIPAMETLVVTYCANTHCPASGKLAAALRTMGYKHVLEYPYGIDGWAAAGMKVEKAK